MDDLFLLNLDEEQLWDLIVMESQDWQDQSLMEFETEDAIHNE